MHRRRIPKDIHEKSGLLKHLKAHIKAQEKQQQTVAEKDPVAVTIGPIRLPSTEMIQLNTLEIT